MGSFAYLYLVRIISESHESVNSVRYETAAPKFTLPAYFDLIWHGPHMMHPVRRTLWTHAQGPIKIPLMAHSRDGWDSGGMRIWRLKIIGL